MFVISLTTKLYSSRCSGRRGAVNSQFTPIYVRELYKLLLALESVINGTDSLIAWSVLLVVVN
jgi:hypothetical protein